LRQEIAELTEKNRRYSLGPKYGSAVADNERRFQRLIEIVEELKSLVVTRWTQCGIESTSVNTASTTRYGVYGVPKFLEIGHN
jgi:hypothetical protein